MKEAKILRREKISNLVNRTGTMQVGQSIKFLVNLETGLAEPYNASVIPMIPYAETNVGIYELKRVS